jgi:hypothetical protein
MQEESGRRKTIQIELSLFDMKKPEEGTVKFILEGGSTEEKAKMIMDAWNHGKYVYFISKISIVENLTKKQLL